MGVVGKLPFIALVLICTTFISSVTCDSTCGNYKTCKDCITSASQRCAWCEESTVGQSTCVGADESATKCQTGKLYNPQSEYKFNVKDYLSRNPSVEISPKTNFVKIRAGETVDVPLSIEVQTMQPVDLYYLTDISGSMEDDMESIKKVATELGDGLKEFTDKLRVGFGTFVDKKMLPYYDHYAKSTKGISQLCEGAFGFCNAMPLENYNADNFQDIINQTVVMDNQDAPEGGFDALLQVLKCKQIKWMDDSRKIVLFTTDNAFHYAGDGKLAGISRVNDGECHYASGPYTESQTMDYPSVYQISDAASINHTAIIFAVVKDVKPLYDKLSSQVALSTVSTIEKDSSNILNVITTQVENLMKKFTFTSKDAPEDLDVSFTNNCPGENKEEKCDGMTMGKKADVTAHIKLKECPSNDKTSYTFFVGASELNYYVQINVEYLCSCTCESTTNSTRCNNAGTYECGVCRCDDGHFGSDCSCLIDDTASDAQCRADGVGSVCAGRGQCICGECHCDAFLEGGNEHKYCSSSLCSTSDFSCGPTRDNLCNSRGDCVCGECVCNANFTGPECGCALATDKCETGGNGTKCNGNGVCECNECKCNERNGQFWYFGERCQKCRTCGDLCSGTGSLMPCVKYHWRNGNISEFKVADANVDQYKKSCKYDDVEFRVVSAEEIYDKLDHVSECTAEGDKGSCTKIFWYDQPSAQQKYIVYYTADPAVCEPTNLYLIILGGVVGGIILLVFIGLATWLLWSYCENLKELKAFDNELKSGLQVQMNPVFDSPVKTYENPSRGAYQQTSSI